MYQFVLCGCLPFSVIFTDELLFLVVGMSLRLLIFVSVIFVVVRSVVVCKVIRYRTICHDKTY